MASPVRFSPTSTLKPSRLSSSAMSRASLMGSFRGASASGYFALPMTSANRSAPAATDGSIGVTDKTKITSKARRVLMPRRSNQQGADSSLRLGDLTLRKPHYQTGYASPVNRLQSRWFSRQLTATRPLRNLRNPPEINQSNGRFLAKLVMPGLVPCIHALTAWQQERRGWPGHARP